MMMTAYPATRGRVPARVILALLASLLLIVLAGCEDQPTEAEDYDPEPLLYAWIEGEAPVDTVTLEWTTKAIGSFDRSSVGIADAEIVMFPVADENGAAVDTTTDPSSVLRFEVAPGRAGYGDYIPTVTDYEPKLLWTYRIEARKPDEGVDMWAETTVPDTFSYYAARKDDPLTPVDIDGDTLTRDEDEIYMVWTESATARGFVMGIVAQTPKEDLMPLDPEWDPNDPDDEIEDQDKVRHGWTFARYDQRAMTIAWIFFDWAGWNELYINAASESYYDYIFSLANRFDPSYTENPAWNMHGGLGLFGAYTQHRFDIYLERMDPVD